LIKAGFEIFFEPKAGIFLWAKHPALADSAELAYKAAEQDILLGPGHLFSPELRTSPWLRFNVIFCDEPALFSFLSEQCRPA
jgi:DNA-binding transcriptional MocR family regulator